MDNAFAYVRKHGIATEASYPYTAEVDIPNFICILLFNFTI